jgi:NADH-quinone oxidoreductase E subunit
MSAALSAGLRAGIEDLAARYPRKSAAMLPALHLVQNAKGFVGPEDEAEVAEALGVPVVQVREVLTFYTMFRRKPAGRHLLQVCTNLSCTLMGGERVLDYLKAKLGIGAGETTADGRFSLVSVECLGACDEAPCLMVNEKYCGRLTEDRIDEILKGLD